MLDTPMDAMLTAKLAAAAVAGLLGVVIFLVVILLQMRDEILELRSEKLYSKYDLPIPEDSSKTRKEVDDEFG